jgi:glycerophosphoryl diester phosphodiesterase
MITAIIMATLLTNLSTQATIKQSWDHTLVVGHRGAADYKPENTIPSFEEAIKSKADAAECDVHVSKDGELIVMHDGTLDRTTSLKGAIKDIDSKTMKAAGIPTLADYLKVTKNHIISVIEIKDGTDVVKKTVAQIKKEGMTAQCIIFSFNKDYIQEAKKLEPKLFAVWLNSKPTDLKAHFETCEKIHADGIGIAYQGANAEIVGEAHRRKMPVFVWTVPPGEIVDRLKALKVNFIISNSPRDVHEQLNKK